jgi:uncharacterized membrane protein
LPFGGVPFHRLSKNEKFWKSNIYLDSDEMNTTSQEKKNTCDKDKILKKARFKTFRV